MFTKTIVAAAALAATVAAQSYGAPEPSGYSTPVASDPAPSSYAAPEPSGYSAVPSSSAEPAGYSATSSAPAEPSGSAPPFPVCWATCFAEYDIQSKDCLCKDSLKDVVSSCIAAGCEQSDTDTYEAWLASYCYVAPVSSNTWPVPSYVVPLPSSYAVPSSYADGTTSAPYPSYSACTATSTLIWRSNTQYSSVVVTSSYAPGSYGVATGTGAAWAPTASASYYDPVPATGAAAKGAKLAGVSFGVAGLIAGVAAVLL